MSAPTSGDSATGDSTRADVELRLPADGAYASVLRTTTAALAARLDFTIDDIEDLRIAVAEAGALVLPAADPGAALTARFQLGQGTMTVEVSTDAMDNPEPDLESFAWQVLDTPASDALVTSEQGLFRVRFTMTSQLAAGSADKPTGAEL
ncbi:anti-sigma factor [Nocardioides sp. B-3]|uniref:anti-sigma factor n=1 Tax=Nocardioides sp. B-3 TaxID=2895565 RepID=UPI002152E17C|nr:anti-sigma factor [Nocardioides sp. B-3]UUZ58323.1 anti-sigma factor [Nocardioides sp. B-3]